MLTRFAHSNLHWAASTIAGTHEAEKNKEKHHGHFFHKDWPLYVVAGVIVFAGAAAFFLPDLQMGGDGWMFVTGAGVVGGSIGLTVAHEVTTDTTVWMAVLGAGVLFLGAALYSVAGIAGATAPAVASSLPALLAL
jgi:hypothetical protein